MGTLKERLLERIQMKKKSKKKNFKGVDKDISVKALTLKSHLENRNGGHEKSSVGDEKRFKVSSGPEFEEFENSAADIKSTNHQGREKERKPVQHAHARKSAGSETSSFVEGKSKLWESSSKSKSDFLKRKFSDVSPEPNGKQKTDSMISMPDVAKQSVAKPEHRKEPAHSERHSKKHKVTSQHLIAKSLGTKPDRNEEKYTKKLPRKAEISAEPASASAVSDEAESFPYPTDDADHAETPVEAYRDIEPVLAKLTALLGKTKETVRVYDPFYCDGGVARRLCALGYPRTINRREDCYAAAAQGRTPPHDVLLTNPPYSGDHLERALQLACGVGSTTSRRGGEGGTPWLMLVPNFVYTKDYYASVAAAAPPRAPFFVVPRKRYTYWTPKWLHATKFGVSTSPFPSFWYVHGGRFARELAAWAVAEAGAGRSLWSKAVMVADGVDGLPNEVRAAFDPNRRRPSPKARQRLARQKKLERSSPLSTTHQTPLQQSRPHSQPQQEGKARPSR